MDREDAVRLDEAQENDTRRDDVVEIGIVRGLDRNDVLESERRQDREEYRRRDAELFDRRMRDRDDSFISGKDRDILRFRDNALHSTAMAGIEEEIEENALAEDAPGS